MDTWTLQAGFPLISVGLEDGLVTASQARFLVCEENVTDPNEPLNSTLGYKWHVPLTYVTSANPKNETMHWMNLTDGECRGMKIVGTVWFWGNFVFGVRCVKNISEMGIADVTAL